MTAINVLLTGATGYIGGSVLSALLLHPRLDGFNITVLIRSKVKTSLFKKVGVTPVVGTYEDSALLNNLASRADVVIACVDADNLNAAKAILGGLRQRHHNAGTTPILIHTSGIGTLVDDARGNYASDMIYSDLNIHQLERLPRTQPHREVDITITDAGEQGYVKTCIILPGLVYGIAKTRLVSLGIQNRRSQQIPAAINAGIDRRQGGVIGKGYNIWSHVHVEDLACLYVQIFNAAINSCPLYVGRMGIYFAENGECETGDILHTVARELSARGCGTSRATVFTRAEMEKYMFTQMMGSNARARGERARLIGWKPVHNTQSMLESIRDEVTASMSTKEAGL